MLEISAENAADYLRDTGRLPQGASARVSVLAGGVSNLVLLIESAGSGPFVLKQSRRQLRTRAEWFSRLERIYREVELMRLIDQLLPAGVVPRVLFEDRENYLFAMEAIPLEHVVWKSELLAGRFDCEIAQTLGTHLATIHHGSAARGATESLRDRQVFHELRVDPFYRRIAQVHPDLNPAIDRMIDEMDRTAVCLVHADFSPKNVLVTRRGDGHADVALVDFETGHWGDPAFDFGFFLSHLLLKGVLHDRRFDEMAQLVATFLGSYWATAAEFDSRVAPLRKSELERRSVPHLAACMLSRIDGKSLVDYLTDPVKQDLVRRVCRDALLQPPDSFEAFIDNLRGAIRAAFP